MLHPTRASLVAGVLALALAGVQSASAQVARATLVADGFTLPLYATAPPSDPRLFVVEEEGVIHVVKAGATLPTPFLDLSEQVSTSSEGGLLSVAFPPDYATSGLFYVYYTDDARDSVVSRFSVSADPDVADPNSEVTVFFIDQSDDFGNHRGGTILFGPDGFLWFASGDGGGSNDPFDRAQDPQSLLGKLLRVDVGPVFAPDSIPVAGASYRIPADNPFVGAAPRDEIWALGFRNPFRWSFDRATGDIWIGDVGSGDREEVDFEPASDPGGRNYGWDVMEGTLCGEEPAPAPPCNDPSLTPPFHEYDHSGDDCTVIGGYVYRADNSLLRGRYFFGDFCTSRVWSLDPATLGLVEHTSELGAAAGGAFDLVGFGEDGSGRLLLVQRSGGAIYRIGPPPPPPPPGWGCGIGPELLGALLLVAGLRRALRPA
jgi:glucose/arabinose dehydrogenase